MLVRCINKKCNHKWDYRGESKDYISCPICHFKFKILRAIKNYVNYVNIPSNIPTDIPSNIAYKKEDIRFVEVDDGLFVEESLSEQFKEVIEQNKLKEIEEESEQEMQDSLNNIPLEDSGLEFKEIPFDVGKHLEHMKNFA